MSTGDVIHMLATAISSDDEDAIFDDDDDDPEIELRPEPSLIYIQQPEQEKPPVIAIPEEPSPIKVEGYPVARASKEGRNADIKAVSFKKGDDVTTEPANLAATSTFTSLGAATESTTPSSINAASRESSPQHPSVSFQEPIDSPQPSRSKILQNPQSPPGIAPAMSDMTSQPPDSPKPAHSILTIEHSTAATPRSTAFLFGMSKPVFAAVSFLLLFTTSSAIFFLSQYVQIPGLNDQIDALTEEVDRLEVQIEQLEEEIDRLTVEVDRLETVVDRLAVENEKLEEQNDRLETENNELTYLNQQLNASNIVLEMQVQNLTNATETLAVEVDRLSEENDQLTNSTETLEMEVDNLGNVVGNLTMQNAILTARTAQLEGQVSELNGNVTQLEGVNNGLNETNQDLATEVDDLEAANAKLQKEVDDLEAIMKFINGTFGEIDETFTEAVKILSGLVEAEQIAALANLQTSYTIFVNAWRCDFPSDFSGEPFIEDPNSPIGEPDYPPVIANVDTNVMNQLCLDTTNFEDYANVEFMGLPPGPLSPYDITSNQLNSAVTRYSAAAINYYFPAGDQVGLTDQNWADAEFDCKGLPPDLAFSVEFTFVNNTVWTPVFP